MKKSTMASQGMALTQIGQAVAHAVVDNGGTDEDTKRILSDEGLRNKIAKLILEEVNVNAILQLLSTSLIIIVPACDGTQTIAQAKGTFLSDIDSNFKNWNLDNPGKETGEAGVQVHELVQDATFSTMLGSLGVGSGLNKLCLTQHQIKAFCEQHSSWLRTAGYATFFLFKENNEFFVARVRVRSDGLRVYVYRFEDAYVWDADFQHRFVVPQLGPQ